MIKTIIRGAGRWGTVLSFRVALFPGKGRKTGKEPWRRRCCAHEGIVGLGSAASESKIAIETMHGRPYITLRSRVRVRYAVARLGH